MQVTRVLAEKSLLGVRACKLQRKIAKPQAHVPYTGTYDGEAPQGEQFGCIQDSVVAGSLLNAIDTATITFPGLAHAPTQFRGRRRVYGGSFGCQRKACGLKEIFRFSSATEKCSMTLLAMRWTTLFVDGNY